MAASTKSGQSASFRLKLKYGDVDAFVQKFARNISPAGIFLPSKKPKKKGTTLRFELMLNDGTTRVFKGVGIVEWVRKFAVDHPRKPHGMGVRFDKLDTGSRKLLKKIVIQRESLGLDNDDETLPEPRSVRLESEPVAPVPVEAETTAVEAEPAGEAVASANGRPATEPVAGADLEALLGIDTATLNAALSRARSIAHKQLEGGAGMEDLQELLVPVRLPPMDAKTANEGLAAALGVAALAVPVPSPLVHEPLPEREAFPDVASTQIELDVDEMNFDDDELLDADSMFDDPIEAVEDPPTRNVAEPAPTDALSDRFNTPPPSGEFGDVTPLPPPPSRSSIEPLPMIPEASSDVAMALDGAIDVSLPIEDLHDPDLDDGEPQSPWDGAEEEEEEEENTNVITLSDEYDDVELIEELDDMEILEIDEEDVSGSNEPPPDDGDAGPKKGFLQRIFKK